MAYVGAQVEQNSSQFNTATNYKVMMLCTNISLNAFLTSGYR